MRRHYGFLSLAGMTCFLSMYTVQATPQPRIALVIGNATYQRASLRTPVNDATDMAATLQQLGFEVTLLHDADLRTMQTALQMFSQRLRHGGVGLFYFAGQGVQISGDMYLIPLGARLEQEQDIQHEAFPVGRVLRDIGDAANPLNIIILAASRNNPFAQSRHSSQRALAVIQAARGMLTAYATAPEAVAGEGTERNSIYTKHLLRHMTTPSLSLENLFKNVRIAVMEETQGRQIPWESSSVDLEAAPFYLVPRSGGASPPTTPSATPSPPALPQRGQ